MSQEEEMAELLNIFLEEARDLLDAIASTLLTWSKDLNNKTCFSDLKRDLHTLKGGARMVNQPKLSALAHELETFSESLLTQSTPVERKAYDLVFEGVDRMNLFIEALAKKEAPPPVEDMIAKFSEKTPTKEVPKEPAIPKALEAVKTEASIVPETKTAAVAEVIRVKSDLLETLNNLSIESNIIRVNLGHFVDNFSSHLTEANRIMKTVQEKIRVVPSEANLHITSDILSMVNLNKGLAQIQSNIESLLSQQARIELELQDRLVDTRMVPFNSVVPRLGRITRQVGEELKKRVDFTVLQSEGEIDRNLLEHLTPSLEHLLRNAIDHGIESPEKRLNVSKPETGKISLRFFRLGNDACIEIMDDGSGINVEAVKQKAVKLGLLTQETERSQADLIRFILEPGFSTREDVSEISGRGVGMDIVNTVVKGLGGNLSIESNPGFGTKFIIRLPFTTSINRALLVVIQGQTYGILLSNVESIVLLNMNQAKENLNKTNAMIKHNNLDYTLKYLGAALGVEERPIFHKATENFPVLLFKFSDFNAALLVDSLAGSQEVVVQSLGPQFKLMDIFSGATMLSDGRVIIVLDVFSIASRAIKKTIEVSKQSSSKRQPVVMVVDDSVTIRTVTKNFLERHKYSVITAKDGLDALGKLEQEKPDIILLDIEMPRMDGLEFAEKIKSNPNFSDIPIIMITFVAGEAHKSRALKLGINKFMSKPYQETDLLDTIELLLEKKL